LAQDTDEVIAAVDLGSNSFHMVVARSRHGQLEIVDRLREMVRLASGLTNSGLLDSASQDRALACLRRFGQRLRDMRAHQVRVVGTNTLRKARNADVFLGAAEEALGQPVEVISGIEEARLIYLGVSHHVDLTEGVDLVVDIGGGSTELMLGQGFEPVRLESLSLGCVGLSRKFFGNGRLSEKRFARARLAVSLELRPVVASFRKVGWKRVIGSSGTIKSAASIAHEMGLEESGISLASIESVIDAMIASGRVEDLNLPGLSPDRKPVFAGGAAILAEVLNTLGIDRMTVSEGALREGLLYDMIGRMRHEDARERSIRAMQAKFHVDEDQVQRVESTAQSLLEAVAVDWGLEHPRYEQLLRWAARLHEVGLDIAHSKYHLHGAYLLANADLPGFSRVEQLLLARLVGNHRRKLDALTVGDLPEDWRGPAFRLIVVLRLAVLLNRARGPVDLPEVTLTGRTDSLVVRIPRKWLGQNPLTRADLVREQEFLGARGFDLVIEPLKVKKIRPDL
jgi:exopolyphosphatase/guanosine-5'-triphosphate,3'-diphosphate pyrophosphatase